MSWPPLRRLHWVGFVAVMTALFQVDQLTATVAAVELALVLIAGSGLVVWLGNRVQAGRTLKAADSLHLSNGRLIWAKFAVRKTATLAAAQLSFFAVGGLAMVIPPNPALTSQAPRLFSTIVLVGVSYAITLLAFDWKEVHRGLIHDTDARDAERDTERDLVRDDIRDAERDIGRDEPRDELRDERRDIERDPPRDETRDVQRDVQRDPRRDTARDADSNGAV